MTLTATLGLQEAARSTWDVAIVGAGPAGAMAARELARRRRTVLLIDRALFPRGKVCGCCLNAHALATLEAVGMRARIVDAGATPLHGIRLAAAGRVAQVPLSGGVALSRYALDAALVDAAIEAGAAFLPRTLAALEPRAGCSHLRRLELRREAMRVSVAARVVLAADGLSGQIAARAGVGEVSATAGARIGAGVLVTAAPAFYAPGSIYMACGRYGYLGLVRLEDDRLNLAAAFDPCWMRSLGGPGQAAVRMLAEVGWPDVPNLAEQNWRGTPTLMRQARRRAAERLFLIGDAAGYIEPFTGEGMAWALAAGRALAPLAAQAAHRWRPQLAPQWEATYRRLLGRRQFVCRTIAAVLRSPRLMRTLIRLLALAPVVAAPLTHYLGERRGPTRSASRHAMTSLAKSTIVV